MIRPTVVLLVFFTLVTGLAYPLLVTGIAQVAFSTQANGSLVESKVGSSLIAQPFTSDAFFWPRPSATVPPYNASASAASNLGPTNPALTKETTSASGLDPHISPQAAQAQVSRVARARGRPDAEIAALVASHTEGRSFGFMGEPRVNVLELNLALTK